MTKYYSTGDKIECEAAEIYSRKITPSVFQNHPIIGRHIKYVCDRNASVEIKRELNPKVAIINKFFSHLDLNDQLYSESLYCLIKGIKPLPISKKSNFSGRHSVQLMNSNVYTFSEISRPFANIQGAIDKRIAAVKKNNSLPK